MQYRGNCIGREGPTRASIDSGTDTRQRFTAVNEEQVEAIVDAELSRMGDTALQTAREFLVAPRPQERHTRSCRLEPTDCWVVAQHGREVIVYVSAAKYAADPWAVLDRDSEDLGQDERFHPSLTDALEDAGWPT